MKVLLCLCACIAVTYAGILSYPVSPFGYHGSYYTGIFPSYSTFARPLITPVLSPAYYSYNVIPGSVFYPGVVHLVPVAPANGKGKPGKKKPGEKGDKKGDKDSKEETTEASKKEESSEETDDLNA